jgi:hypothetical protein
MEEIDQTKPRFCKKNHDTWILGRDTGSTKECSECRRIRVRKNRRRFYEQTMSSEISRLRMYTKNRINELKRTLK